MAILIMMHRKKYNDNKKYNHYKRCNNYSNHDAVENLLRYILRIRKTETRQNDLIMYGGKGVSLNLPPENIIKQFLYVQNLFQIDSRGGKRMYHEVLNLNDEEAKLFGEDMNKLYQFAMICCDLYYMNGYQVVFAVHFETEKRLHIHFAVNAVNYINGQKWHTSFEDRGQREVYFNLLLEKYTNSNRVQEAIYYA